MNNKSYIGIIERGKTKIIKKSDGTKQTIDLPKSSWLVIERPDVRIVDQALWDSVRERFKDFNLRKLRSGSAGKPFRYDGQVNHVFTSLCLCETCGDPIVVVTGRKGGYYGCRNSHRQKTCANNRVVRCQKLETPILQFLADQLNDEEICKVLAQKYNDLRKKRISQDNGGIDNAAKKLGEVEQSIHNIISAIEQGAVSEVLIQKLKQLEAERNDLAGKIKFLGGADHSEIYITPGVIKNRFQEIPELLRSSKPFELNKALRGIVGKTGIKLSYRTDGDKGEYWAVGSLNIGRALTMVDHLGYGDSAAIKHEVSFEIGLSWSKV